MATAPDPLLRIELMYHFTDERNLPMIQRLQGIWSTAKLRKGNSEFFPGGNQWSLDQDERSGMDRYVHLCWARGHPMEYYIRQRDSSIRLKHLEIDRLILYEPGVLFSPGVSNAVGMEPCTVQEAAERELIDYDAFYGNIGPLYQAGPQARRAKAEKSEILVPERVHIKFIKNLPNG